LAGALKVKNKHLIPVILDADILELFKKAINNQPIGEYFRRHQREVVEEYVRKNSEALGIPILSEPPKERQTTVNEYVVSSFMDYDLHELESMSNAMLERFRSKCVDGSVAAAQLRKKRKVIRR